MPNDFLLIRYVGSFITWAPNLWSLVTIPALAGIWLTAFFALNSIRPPTLRAACTWPGALDFFQGLSALAVTLISFTMLMAVCVGANIYSWRGCVLMWGIWGMFAFAGHFHPWRRFLRRAVQMDRLEREWRGRPAPSNRDLSELIAEGRRALSVPVRDRAYECMRVMPRIVVALERVAAKQLEVATIRAELQQAVIGLRRAIAEDAPTAALVQRINSLIDRLDGALQNG